MVPPMPLASHPVRCAAVAAALVVCLGAAPACEMAKLGGTGPVLPTRLTFSPQPEYAMAGAPIGPVVAVTILDSNGDTASYDTAIIRIAILNGTGTRGASLSGTTAVATVNGTANFSNLAIDSVGTGYRLLAGSQGLGNALSDAFDVTPGPPARLAFLRQPGSGVAGDTLATVEVGVEDAVGNLEPSAFDSVSVTLGTNPGGAALRGTTVRPAVGGIATFAGLSISAAGSGYTLVASAPDRASATSDPFTVTASARVAGR